MWNRPSVRSAWLGVSGPGDAHGEPEAEPGYSVLAVSDPSADSTTTQTWAAIEDDLRVRDWSPSRAERNWGSHAEDTRPPARPETGRSPGLPPGGAAGSTTVGRRGPQVGPPAGGEPAGRGGGPAGAGAAGAGPDGMPQPPPARPARQRREPAAAAPQVAAPQGAAPQVAATPADGRRRTAGGGGAPAPRSRGARPRKRGNTMMAALLLSPVLVVVLVVAGYIYITGRHASSSAHAALSSHAPTPVVSASPTPTLGPWKHIESRALDTLPLSLAELFPAHFTAGLGGGRTIDRAAAKCDKAVIGKALQKAVGKAHCTQVLRASYLSGNGKLMATIGVLNLLDVKAAERAGKASGAREFIKQLPAKHGPTHRLSKGTGLEEADVVGHYLILTWAEFTNLHRPSGKRQVAVLKKFSADLITGTASISLTSRMVIGAPRTPPP